MAGSRFVWRPRDVLRGLGDALDLVPYVAILSWPFAWVGWTLGVPGDSAPEAVEASWWFLGYLATLAYIPAVLICALVERQARKRNWRHMRPMAQTVRWTLFAVAYGPILAFTILLALPDRWIPF